MFVEKSAHNLDKASHVPWLFGTALPISSLGIQIYADAKIFSQILFPSLSPAHFAPGKQQIYSHLLSQLQLPEPTLKLIKLADDIAMNRLLERILTQVIATSEVTFNQLFDDAVVPWTHV